MSSKPILPLLLILFAATAIACGNDSKECTLIGCENGINLNFEDTDGKPITAFSGTITIATKEIAIECAPNADPHAAAYSCMENGVFLRATNAKELNVDIHATDNPLLKYTGDVKVTHEPLYPNGKECGEACQQATKTVVMVTTEAQ